MAVAPLADGGVLRYEPPHLTLTDEPPHINDQQDEDSALGMTTLQEASLLSMLGDVANAKLYLLRVFQGECKCRCRRNVRHALASLEPALSKAHATLGLQRVP